MYDLTTNTWFMTYSWNCKTSELYCWTIQFKLFQLKKPRATGLVQPY